MQGTTLTASPWERSTRAWTSAGPQPSGVSSTSSSVTRATPGKIWNPRMLTPLAPHSVASAARAPGRSGRVARTRHNMPRWCVQPGNDRGTGMFRACKLTDRLRPASRTAARPWRRPAAPGATGRRAPARRRGPAHSTASTTPSSARAVTRQHGPGSSTAWWCSELTTGAGTEQRRDQGPAARPHRMADVGETRARRGGRRGCRRRRPRAPAGRGTPRGVGTPARRGCVDQRDLVVVARPVDVQRRPRVAAVAAPGRRRRRRSARGRRPGRAARRPGRPGGPPAARPRRRPGRRTRGGCR